MRFDPYSKIKVIEDRMREIHGASFEIKFSDNTVRLMTFDRLGEMYDSVTNNGSPNEDAQFFLDKLAQGVEDESGLCHLVAGLATDQAELWGDEYEHTGTR